MGEEEEPDKELIEAVRIGVKRLESLAAQQPPPSVEIQQEQAQEQPQQPQQQPSPPIMARPDCDEEPLPETHSPVGGINFEPLNTLILAGFMTSIIGSKAALDMLSTFRNMGWLSAASFNKLSAALRTMPDKEGIAVDRTMWHEILLLVIRKYERNPGDPELLLLVRLIEALSQTGGGIVELR